MAMTQDGLALPRLTSFSTRGAPRGAEVDYWRQARKEAYVSVRTDPVGSAFGGEIGLGQYAEFRLSTKRARPEEVRRSASDIAQGREDEEYLFLVFQLRGSLLVEQAGRRTLATPGSLVIYDSAVPFSLSAKECYEQVVLELPADKAFSLAGVSRSNDLLARTFDCGGAIGAVAAFFVNLAQRQDRDRLGAHRIEPQATALGTSLIGLIAPGQCGMPESLRRGEALAYMRAHLADPDLDAEGIAAGLHVSRRTLFRLFEGTGESAMARLRSLRLERARLMLRTQPGKQISTIAQETGFSSPVQFHRAFRAVAGMTPGEYREANLTGGPAAPVIPGLEA
ncbi:helix-turn-helix domain-containing protein [Streptomyces sp. ESR1.13]|uniref:helix-turn-helix domain-containing protein n=1 Tax=unclassified Streptomyces TaxID=2593676 RepID=UPI0040425F05